MNEVVVDVYVAPAKLRAAPIMSGGSKRRLVISFHLLTKHANHRLLGRGCGRSSALVLTELLLDGAEVSRARLRQRHLMVDLRVRMRAQVGGRGAVRLALDEALVVAERRVVPAQRRVALYLAVDVARVELALALVETVRLGGDELGPRRGATAALTAAAAPLGRIRARTRPEERPESLLLGRLDGYARRQQTGLLGADGRRRPLAHYVGHQTAVGGGRLRQARAQRATGGRRQPARQRRLEAALVQVLVVVEMEVQVVGVVVVMMVMMVVVPMVAA